MSARRLPAGKDDADDLLLCFRGILPFLKSDLLFAVCVRKQRLNLFLIRYALRFLAFLYTDVCDAVSQHSRKFRRIRISSFL